MNYESAVTPFCMVCKKVIPSFTAISQSDGSVTFVASCHGEKELQAVGISRLIAFTGRVDLIFFAKEAEQREQDKNRAKLLQRLSASRTHHSKRTKFRRSQLVHPDIMR